MAPLRHGVVTPNCKQTSWDPFSVAFLRSRLWISSVFGLVSPFLLSPPFISWPPPVGLVLGGVGVFPRLGIQGAYFCYTHIFYLAGMMQTSCTSQEKAVLWAITTLKEFISQGSSGWCFNTCFHLLLYLALAGTIKILIIHHKSDSNISIQMPLKLVFKTIFLDLII